MKLVKICLKFPISNKITFILMPHIQHAQNTKIVLGVSIYKLYPNITHL